MGGVIVSRRVHDANFRRDGNDDADVRVCAIIQIANQRAFLPGTGAKHPVAHGEIFRGDSGEQWQRQEQKEWQETFGFHAMRL